MARQHNSLAVRRQCLDDENVRKCQWINEVYVIVITVFERYPSTYYLMQSICGIVATLKF